MNFFRLIGMSLPISTALGRRLMTYGGGLLARIMPLAVVSLIAALCGLASAGTATAQTTEQTIGAIQRGFVSQRGDLYQVASTTMAIGRDPASGVTYRGFARFGIPNGGEITGAVLRVGLGGARRGEQGPVEVRAAPDFVAGNTAAAYDALRGAGPVIGQFAPGDAQQTESIDVPISAAGLAALNASRGQNFYFGLAREDETGGGFVAGLSPPATQLILTFAPSPPSVSGLAPTSGPTTGGTSVTISGANFTDVTAVTFGGVPATSFTVSSATRIVAVTPPGTAGAAAVYVTTKAGTNDISVAPIFTYILPAPTVTSLSPAAGPRSGGNSVTVTGTNLTDATAVFFGNAQSPSFKVDSATQITAVAPANAGEVNVRVVTPAGTSPVAQGNLYNFVAAPFILSATPSRGPVAGGTSVTISGGFFQGATSVSIGSTVASFTVDSNGQITAVTSSGRAGAATIQVTTPGGLAVLESGFTFVEVTVPGLTAQARIGQAYDQRFTATGGRGPYSYAVTAGRLPAGLSLGTDGRVSGTPTEAGAFTFTVTGTDTDGVTGSVMQSLTVEAPDTTPAPPVTYKATADQAFSQQLPSPTATGPYTFALSVKTPLPDGLTLSSTGLISGTPTETGIFDKIEITVTDSSTGVGAPFVFSQAYIIDVAPGIPTAGPVTTSVTFGSNGTDVTLNLSGGAATPVAVVTPPTNGTATASGLGIRYRPNPGYAGADSFTYTASNAFGTSDPATVTITVPDPTLNLTGERITTTAGQAIDRQLSATGGFAPYTYALTSGSLPAGVTLSAVGTLSGTPTEGGSFAFTVTATDASSGNGPFTTSGTYTLDVGAPTVAIVQTSLTNGTVAQAYSQQLTTTGGVAPYSYAVTAGKLPVGMALSPSGLLSGTPTSGGSFAFTVTATDSATGTGPFQGSRAYAFTVDAPAITVTPATLATATRGAAYSQAFSAEGGVGTYTYAVTAGRLPAGLTLSSAGVLSGTPTATGTFSLTVTATDSATGSGPYTGSVAVTLEVEGAVIAVSPAVLPHVLEGTTFQQAFSASGGYGAYSYAVTDGALPQGVTLTPAGVLSGRPAAEGGYGFTVTATDAFDNAGSVALVLEVTGRPDPAQDAEVRGLASAQVDATRRLIDAQVGNFSRRLEQLRIGSPRSSMNLSVDASAFMTLDDPASVRGELGRVMGQGLVEELVRRDEEAVRRTAPGSDPAPVARQGEAGPVRVWTGGVISVGDRSADGNVPELSVRSSGISLGADVSLGEQFDVGFGVGFGQEETDVGLSGSRVEADSWVGVGYASWRPTEGVFFDGLIGRGDLSFDLARRVSSDGTMVFGQREGEVTFGAFTWGVDMVQGSSRWIGYGRLQATDAELAAFTETGSDLWSLSYGQRTVESRQGAIGLRYLHTVTYRGATMTPGLRIEWSREFGDAGVQSIRYADWLDGDVYSLTEDGWERSQGLIGFTFSREAPGGWGIDLDIESRFVSRDAIQSLRLTINRAF